MEKKVKYRIWFKIKVLLLFYLLITTSALIQSCCQEDFKITSQANVNAWELYQSENGIGRRQISKVKGDFILSIYFQEQLVSLGNFSLMSNCSALTCKETYQNSIDEKSLNLSLNRDIVLNGDSIPSNTNLLKIDNSGLNLHDLAAGWIEFRFTDEFFQKVKMENGYYTFIFNGKTTDEVVLNAEIIMEVAL